MSSLLHAWTAKTATARRFAVTGALATAVHVLVAYTALLVVAVSPFSANLVAFCVALAFSYIGHARWTFRRPGLGLLEFVRFSGVAVCAFAAGNGFLLACKLYALPDGVALGFSIAVVPAVSFLLSRALVFREVKPEAGPL